MPDFEEIKRKIAEFRFNEEFDIVVAVANGGIIPAAMINQRLAIEFNVIKINLRDPSQKPIYDHPRLLEALSFDPRDKRILLVEDRVKTGASLALAVKILQEAGAAEVKTFAVNGKADYPLYDIPCFKFPWII